MLYNKTTVVTLLWSKIIVAKLKVIGGNVARMIIFDNSASSTSSTRSVSEC